VLTAGQPAPPFALTNQRDDVVTPAALGGRKTYIGIERSAVLIGIDGVVRHAWYKISPKDTPTRPLEPLAR
jgi:peroxiredoxin